MSLLFFILFLAREISKVKDIYISKIRVILLINLKIIRVMFIHT